MLTWAIPANQAQGRLRTAAGDAIPQNEWIYREIGDGGRRRALIGHPRWRGLSVTTPSIDGTITEPCGVRMAAELGRAVLYSRWRGSAASDHEIAVRTE